jgi:hypothetical protein
VPPGCVSSGALCIWSRLATSRESRKKVRHASLSWPGLARRWGWLWAPTSRESAANASGRDTLSEDVDSIDNVVDGWESVLLTDRLSATTEEGKVSRSQAVEVENASGCPTGTWSMGLVSWNSRSDGGSQAGVSGSSAEPERFAVNGVRESELVSGDHVVGCIMPLRIAALMGTIILRGSH